MNIVSFAYGNQAVPSYFEELMFCIVFEHFTASIRDLMVAN